MARCVLLAALAVWLVAVAEASACSCVYVGPRAAIRGADGAFVGRVVRIKRAEHGWSNAPAVFTFRVGRRLKGRMGRRIRVHTVSGGESCGLELRRGERTGLVMERRRRRWHASLCDQYGPRELARAARRERRSARRAVRRDAPCRSGG